VTTCLQVVTVMTASKAAQAMTLFAATQLVTAKQFK